MKLYVSKAEDRDQVIVILARARRKTRRTIRP